MKNWLVDTEKTEVAHLWAVVMEQFHFEIDLNNLNRNTIQLLTKIEISLTDSISGQTLIVEIDRNRQKSRNED